VFIVFAQERNGKLDLFTTFKLYIFKYFINFTNYVKNICFQKVICINVQFYLKTFCNGPVART